MNILVTGGAGYIGSHFVKRFENNGNIVVLDNLSRGNRNSIGDNVVFYQNDIHDTNQIEQLIKSHSIKAVVHFAAFAYVGESVQNPTIYYKNNVVGTINLLDAIIKCGVKNIIFSSTCSIYGNCIAPLISENEPPSPMNPYAKTKFAIENILHDYDSAFGLKFISLRYFNAAGADPNGEIGESHYPEPHLIPIILQCASGEREKISVFGNDYSTTDGTCIRDYIHVNDLADAHIKALEYLLNEKKSDIFNLGTGTGASVLEIIKTSENVTGRKINYEIVTRRDGDPDRLVADYSKIKKELGWQPQFSLNEIIKTAWNWQLNKKY